MAFPLRPPTSSGNSCSHWARAAPRVRCADAGRSVSRGAPDCAGVSGLTTAAARQLCDAARIMVSTVSSSPTPRARSPSVATASSPREATSFCLAGEIAQAAPNYLAEEMRQRVARAPVRFNVRVQIPEPGDTIDDPSMAWPDQRKTIGIGRPSRSRRLFRTVKPRNARCSSARRIAGGHRAGPIRCSRRAVRRIPSRTQRRHP